MQDQTVRSNPNFVASNVHRGVCVSWLEALFWREKPEVRTRKRHLLLEYLWGSPTSKDLTVAQARVLLEWALVDLDEADQGIGRSDRISHVEAARIVRFMEGIDAN
jgi:hypothetical protein